jgi:hypothetical protein
VFPAAVARRRHDRVDVIRLGDIGHRRASRSAVRFTADTAVLVMPNSFATLICDSRIPTSRRWRNGANGGRGACPGPARPAPDVPTHVSLLSISSAGLSEPTPLAGDSDAGSSDAGRRIAAKKLLRCAPYNGQHFLRRFRSNAVSPAPKSAKVAGSGTPPPPPPLPIEQPGPQDSRAICSF